MMRKKMKKNWPPKHIFVHPPSDIRDTKLKDKEVLISLYSCVGISNQAKGGVFELCSLKKKGKRHTEKSFSSFLWGMFDFRVSDIAPIWGTEKIQIDYRPSKMSPEHSLT